MKKIIALFLIMVGAFCLIGCTNSASKNQENTFEVYSFNGTNEQVEISNGVIVIGVDEETFYGGDLGVVQEDLFSDISSFTTTFYTIIDGEQRTIISDSVVDETGGSVNIEGGLGKASGDGFILGNKADMIDDLYHNFWFELKTIDTKGNEDTYQLQLSVTAITD